METPATAVRFELLLDDYRALLKHVCAPGPGALPIERILWLVAVLIASFGMVAFGRDGRLLLAGLIAGFLLMSVRVLRMQQRLRPRPGGALLCHYDVQLSQDGVRVQTPHWTCDVPWRGVLAVEETAAHCFFRIDTISAYAIPKRAFSNAEAMQQFLGFARDSVARERVAPSPSH